eukprot:1163851-Rhodomonas_salina.2
MLSEQPLESNSWCSVWSARRQAHDTAHNLGNIGAFMRLNNDAPPYPHSPIRTIPASTVSAPYHAPAATPGTLFSLALPHSTSLHPLASAPPSSSRRPTLDLELLCGLGSDSIECFDHLPDRGHVACHPRQLVQQVRLHPAPHPHSLAQRTPTLPRAAPSH